MNFNARRAALTGGIVWGMAIFITTLASVYTGYSYGMAFLNVMASIYPGYRISLPGSIIGLVYGFLDGFIGVYVILWVYRKLP